MPLELTPAMMEVIVALLLDDHPGYTFAATAESLPEAYGAYMVFSGHHSQGGGMSRNLRRSFSETPSYPNRLFLWKPDADGAVRKWMDTSHEHYEAAVVRLGPTSPTAA